MERNKLVMSGEMARIVGIPQRTFDYYVQKGKIKPAETIPYRLYDPVKTKEAFKKLGK